MKAIECSKLNSELKLELLDLKEQITMLVSDKLTNYLRYKFQDKDSNENIYEILIGICALYSKHKSSASITENFTDLEDPENIMLSYLISCKNYCKLLAKAFQKYIEYPSVEINPVGRKNFNSLLAVLNQSDYPSKENITLLTNFCRAPSSKY